MELRGRTFVITGGTGALGSAVVRRLAEEGATCHVTWVSEREREAFTVAGDVHLHRADLMDESAVDALYTGLDPLWGSIHIAGGFTMAPVAETTVERFTFMWRLNALTAFLCSRAAVRCMQRTGEGGRIVQVAARQVLQPTGGAVAYAMSKAGVATLTQCLAEEVKRDDILVNAVVPSIMDTPANRSAMPDADHTRWPTVDEVAHTIVSLAHPANRVISGALVPVFGRA